MLVPLETVRLRNGEDLQVEVIVAPEPDYKVELAEFLGHKGAALKWQVEQALARPLDELRSYFYIGRIDGRIATHVYVAASGVCGFLGHVYTRPEDRRKGAYSALMDVQMQHARTLGLQVIQLGTAYDSAAYHIYHHFGFRSLAPGSGRMRWVERHGVVEGLYSEDKITQRPLGWSDWPWCALLFCEGGAQVKSAAMRVVDDGWSKPGFIELMADASASGVAAVNRAGAVVGVATRVRDARWRYAEIVDVFAHPLRQSVLPELLRAVTADRKRLQAYLPVGDAERRALLEADGFRLEAVLPAQLAGPDGPADLWVMGRGA